MICINILLYLSAIFFSFGQLGRISFFSQQVNLYAYELVLGLLLCNLVYRYWLTPIKQFVKKYRFTTIFLGYLFLSLLISSITFSFFENLIATMYYFRLVFYELIFCYITYLVKANPKIKVTIVRIIYFYIIVTIFTAGIQYVFYPDLRNLNYMGWDEHYYRTFGLFFDASVAGAVYGLLIIFIAFRIKERKSKIFHIILLFLLILIAVLTYSRSLYISFVLLGIYFLFMKLKQKKVPIIRYLLYLLLLAGLVFSIFSLIPKQKGEGVNLSRTYSIFSRVDDYKTALDIWIKNPIIGIGYNHIGSTKRKLNLLKAEQVGINHAGNSFHSSYLIILVCGGIIGLFLFIKSAYELYRKFPGCGYCLLLIGLLSLSDNILLHQFVLFLLILLISNSE